MVKDMFCLRGRTCTTSKIHCAHFHSCSTWWANHSEAWDRVGIQWMSDSNNKWYRNPNLMLDAHYKLPILECCEPFWQSISLLSLNMFFFTVEKVLTFLSITAGAVLQPRDPRLRWVRQPAKSGSSQVSEERIWVYVDGCRWVSHPCFPAPVSFSPVIMRGWSHLVWTIIA